MKLFNYPVFVMPCFMIITVLESGCISKNHSAGIPSSTSMYVENGKVLGHKKGKNLKSLNADDGIKGGIALFSIDNYFNEMNVKIDTVNNIVVLDASGIGIRFCNKRRTEMFFFICIVNTNNTNKVLVEVYPTFEKEKSGILYLVGPGSSFEKKMCAMVEGIIRDSSSRLERDNAKELLKVLKNREHECNFMIYDGRDG